MTIVMPLSGGTPARGAVAGTSHRPVHRPAHRPAPTGRTRRAAGAGPLAGPGADRHPGLAARLLIGLGLALLPWLVVLATTLPGTATADHWALAWTGLDCLEAAGLISTGVLLRRGDPRRCLTAAATAVLLLCDAWFDTTTSAPGAQFGSAVAMAVLVELPLACCCVRLALRALPRG